MTPGCIAVWVSFMVLANPSRPTHPPTHRNHFLRETVGFIKGAGNLRPIVDFVLASARKGMACMHTHHSVLSQTQDAADSY